MDQPAAPQRNNIHTEKSPSLLSGNLPSTGATGGSLAGDSSAPLALFVLGQELIPCPMVTVKEVYKPRILCSVNKAKCGEVVSPMIRIDVYAVLYLRIPVKQFHKTHIFDPGGNRGLLQFGPPQPLVCLAECDRGGVFGFLGMDLLVRDNEQK